MQQRPVLVVSRAGEKRSRFLNRLFGALIAVVAVGFAFADLYPYFFSVIASLRKGIDVYSGGWKLSDLTLYAYNRVLFDVHANESTNMLRWMFNSAWVAAVTTLLTLLMCSMAGYALARLNFRGKKVWFALILCVMMVPGQVTMITKYIMITTVFKWYNSFIGIIVPFLFSPYYTFMMRQFFPVLSQGDRGGGPSWTACPGRGFSSEWFSPFPRLRS